MGESNLLKIALATGNDERFMLRIKIACQLAGISYDDHNITQVTNAVVDSIALNGDDFMVVDTSGVTDEQIMNAARALVPTPVE